ncbi:MAG: DUF1254 domain-containing protein [Gordonia sp. (in: high G+C Gram-positive bacteria)]|uniref:DUF1254 domain-containing protein n=1 Tax=Gordonia TaxID=2053 RepID=UPI003265C25F
MSLQPAVVTDIARDAYVFAYPLVLGDLTMRKITNVTEPRQPFGPLGVLAHARGLPGPEFRVVIRPNVDTLYTSAYLDLGPEPTILTIPQTERYTMVPLYDLWSNVFAVPGSRTTGTERTRHFLLAGPGWTGQVPDGVERIDVPTRFMSFIGRTQVNGVDDLPAVHLFQDGMALTPLSQWGQEPSAPVRAPLDPDLDMRTPPPDLVAAMSAQDFLTRFTELLNDNPPSIQDYPTLHRLQRLGWSPEAGLDLAGLAPEIAAAVEDGIEQGRQDIVAEYNRLNGEGRLGWIYTTEGGSYGVHYLLRAGVAAWGLGMNLAADAVYPSIAVDADGRLLSGENSYTLTFPAGELPPALAFWSVTAYDDHGFLIENPLARYALGDRSGIPPRTDGSVELIMQATDPGGEDTARWLPTGPGGFNLMLRVYSPDRALLDGSWEPPLVRRR